MNAFEMQMCHAVDIVARMKRCVGESDAGTE